MWQVVDLLGLHNHVSPFLSSVSSYTHQSLYIHPIGSVSLENADQYSGFRKDTIEAQLSHRGLFCSQENLEKGSLAFRGQSGERV